LADRDYDGKWKPNSGITKVTPPDYFADVPPRLKARWNGWRSRHSACWGCRFTPVDFRVKPPAKPYILE